jgi:mRNA-degrading endonuclease RelE of RelBE toxin-antitoxin system
VTYAVLLHPKAAKELEKLEKPTRLRMIDRLKELCSNPERAGKILKRSDFWSLRAGDYRAIYEIDRKEKRVVILYISHRSKVYDDFSKML